MKVYHGSESIIPHPCIIKTTRRVDYGIGLYATTSYEQAEDWVLHKRQNKLLDEGFVNVYEFDEEAARSVLKIKLFDLAPTPEWFDFVENNRMNPDFQHDWDAVYGPVADDRVYAAFALYESNVLDKESAIKELKTYKLKDQWLFHTEEALKYLTFVEAITVKRQ